MINRRIDAGREFDWGKTSADYAKYRDIYPVEFYRKILDLELCVAGQKVLDLGTGTGVLPRNLYSHGAQFTGADISQNQIREAKRLAEEAGMKIEFVVSSAEVLDYPENTFDVVTACQCFFYFDTAVLLPRLSKMLKPGGKLLILSMEWLPEEDKIAAETEKLVLKYNPQWSGAGEVRHPIFIPKDADHLFRLKESFQYDLLVPFTRESWNGRIRSCRGIGASLSPGEVRAFEEEHLRMLEAIAPENFTVLHSAAMAVLQNRKHTA